MNNHPPKTRFPSGIAEQLRAYIYVLRDPETKQIFYIGKGNGDRVFDHANCALDDDGISLKNEQIRKILARGQQVEAFIVQHGLADHENSRNSHAHQTESALFGLFKLLDSGLNNDQFSLLNIVAPPSFNEFGLRSVADVIAKYGEPADVSQIPHNSMFIKPTHTWDLGMPDDELYEITRGWWGMNINRASEIQYVFSIPKLIIRAVYEIKPSDWRERIKPDRDWEHDLGKKPRIGFHGADVSARFPNLINKSVEAVYPPGQARRKDWKYLDEGAARDLRKKGQLPWWNYPK